MLSTSIGLRAEVGREEAVRLNSFATVTGRFATRGTPMSPTLSRTFLLTGRALKTVLCCGVAFSVESVHRQIRPGNDFSLVGGRPFEILEIANVPGCSPEEACFDADVLKLVFDLETPTYAHTRSRTPDRSQPP